MLFEKFENRNPSKITHYTVANHLKTNSNTVCCGDRGSNLATIFETTYILFIDAKVNG